MDFHIPLWLLYTAGTLLGLIILGLAVLGGAVLFYGIKHGPPRLF
jgi:hypothetical protein